MLMRRTDVTGVATINQGYLSKGGRFRRREWWLKDGEMFYNSAEIARTQHIFTYKHDLVTQPGVLEIETEVSEADFNLGWPDTINRILKTRFMLTPDMGAGVWEVDVFYDKLGRYLALAEFEVPADAGPPDRLHPLVQNHLIYAVSEGDSRFANRKLGNREYVTKLLQEIAQ
jgi:hypothetical protein